MSNVKTITDAELEKEVLHSDLPVLIDFFADWCGPCKTLSPRVEALADDTVGRLKVFKLDVDQNPMAVQMFRIQAMPTLVLVHERQIVDVIQGAVDRKALDAFVAPVLSASGSGGVEAWDPDRLKLALEATMVVPVDLRDDADFQRARLPGVVSVPAAQLAGRVAELRALGETLIAYDRDGTTASDNAKILADAGITAGYLDGGLLAWEAAFYPVQKG